MTIGSRAAAIIVLNLFFVALNSFSEVKIGAILPLSGDGANAGEGCRNSIQLALEELKPEVRAEIKVIYEDDVNQAKNTVSAYSRLRELEKIDAVLNLSSGTCQALAPLVESHRIPLIAIASDLRIVEGRTFPHNLWVTPPEEVKLLIKEIERRGYRKIAVANSINPFAEAVWNAWRAAGRDDVKVVLKDEFNSDGKDFRPFLAKLKNHQDVDAVFVNLYIGQTGIFARQAKELGIKLPLFNVETFEDLNELKLSQGGLVGAWYIQAEEPKGEFLEKYRGRFPGASQWVAANCHDAILLLGRAWEEGKKTPEQINQFLRQVENFSGALGTFSAKGDGTFTLPATVKVVTKDGFKKLQVD